MKPHSKHLLTDANLEQVARLMAALSEVARLKLVRALMDGPKTVSELVIQTGMKQGNVSKHLGILLVNAIVSRSQEGNFARYELRDASISQLCDVVCHRLSLERPRA
jgi:ArsR family transcriptional regulator